MNFEELNRKYAKVGNNRINAIGIMFISAVLLLLAIFMQIAFVLPESVVKYSIFAVIILYAISIIYYELNKVRATYYKEELKSIYKKEISTKEIEDEKGRKSFGLLILYVLLSMACITFSLFSLIVGGNTFVAYLGIIGFIMVIFGMIFILNGIKTSNKVIAELKIEEYKKISAKKEAHNKNKKQNKKK